jgi:nucleoside-diphosphate-sugar epimerase
VRVVITGAAGQIGRQMVKELSDSHELRLIDKVPVARRKLVVADLAKDHRNSLRRAWPPFGRAYWADSFQGADVVLHLAADVRNNTSWESALRNNIQATWNVIESAARSQVPRVIFASSNWAIRALEQELAPACYQVVGPKIAADAPPRPMRSYGISKAFGELAGQMLVDQGKLHSFVAVRIGAYALAPHKTDERLRAIWIGVRDLRSLLRRCVELSSSGFHVVYGISAQPTAPYDLSYTRRFLSWEPRQNAMDH